MRLRSENKAIYRWNNGVQMDELLLDFNDEPGDTLIEIRILSALRSML